jgi:hypothetical protein
MADNRPPTISVKELSHAVEQAVKIASEKHKVQFAPGLLVAPGSIMGRQLLEDNIPISKAGQIAAEITQHVTAGVSKERVRAGKVFIIDGRVIYLPPWVILGFIIDKEFLGE